MIKIIANFVVITIMKICLNCRQYILCSKFKSFDNNINLPYDDFGGVLDWIPLFNFNQNNKLFNKLTIAVYNYIYEYKITIIPKDYILDNLNDIINTLKLFFDDKEW